MKTLTYLAAAACLIVVGCAASPAADKGLQAYSPDEPAAASAKPAPAPVAAATPAPAPTAPAARPAPTAATLAAGKTTLESSCAACHAPTIVSDSRHTEAEWDEIIDTMISRGAAVADEDRKPLLAYLTATYGR